LGDHVDLRKPFPAENTDKDYPEELDPLALENVILVPEEHIKPTGEDKCSPSIRINRNLHLDCGHLLRRRQSEI
jgi:hypothetical protein